MTYQALKSYFLKSDHHHLFASISAQGLKIDTSKRQLITRESVVGYVIQANGTVECEDGLQIENQLMKCPSEGPHYTCVLPASTRGGEHTQIPLGDD